MMRCVRFATQLRFQIEDETQEALRRNAKRIKIISQERIIDELNKIMLAQYPSIGLEHLQDCGILQIIMPELSALDNVEERNGRAHKNNFYHTLEVLENVCRSTSNEEETNLWLRWAALLHDIGKPRSKRWEEKAGWTFHNHNYIGQKMIAPIFRRMKLPLDERMSYVEKLVGLHMRPIAIADDGNGADGVKHDNGKSFDVWVSFDKKYYDMPYIYYYGYHAYILDDKGQIESELVVDKAYDNNGYLRVYMPEDSSGIGHVLVMYRKTFIQKLAYIMSVVSTVATILVLARKKRG